MMNDDNDMVTIDEMMECAVIYVQGEERNDLA